MTEQTDDPIRERILKCAIRLFANQGYSGTSVRQVVEAAGVTKPTLYYWFDNKEGLYREAVGAQLLGLRDLVSATMENEEADLASRLRAFLQVYIGGALCDPDVVRLLMFASAPGTNAPEVELFPKETPVLDHFAALMRAAQERGELRPGVDPRFAIEALMGSANHLIIQSLHGIAMPEDAVDKLFELFWNGVGK